MARVGKAKVQLTYDRDKNYNRSNEMLYKDYVYYKSCTPSYKL